jgi:putative restriction endonuclease
LKGDLLDFADLAGGFEFGGERIPQSIHSGDLQAAPNATPVEHQDVFPRRGARVWYDDQRGAHHQIYAGDESSTTHSWPPIPNSPDNRWLRDAMQQQIPVIYFLGTSPGRY